MIKAEQIYQATNDGLDIIFALYPDAKNCFAKYCTDGNVKKRPKGDCPWRTDAAA